jgi:VCBS repeat-containing protein
MNRTWKVKNWINFLSVSLFLMLFLGVRFQPQTTVEANSSIVSNTQDDGPGSLRQAILDAQPGDIIDLSQLNGTITLTSGAISIDKSIILSGPGPEKLTVEANNRSRIFIIEEKISTELLGLTLSNGYDIEQGGAILVDKGRLTIENCRFTHNTTSNGGVIYNNEGTLSINNSAFGNNNASYHGGAIHVYSGTLEIENSSFEKNQTLEDNGRGGSIFLERQSTLIIRSNSHFNQNQAVNGGAIYSLESEVLLSQTHFFNNQAVNFGGAVHLQQSLLQSEYSTFGSNLAGISGGAIFHANGTLIIDTATISGNMSVFQGGGIFIDQSGLSTIDNSVLNANSAETGGGIYADQSTVNLNNTHLAKNNAKNGGGIFANEINLHISQTLFEENQSQAEGGGIYLNTGTTTLVNSTFALNSAERGGAICGVHGTVQVNSCTIAENSASLGGGIYAYAFLDTQLQNSIVAINTAQINGQQLSGQFTSLDYNLIGSPDGFRLQAAGPHDLTGTAPNLLPLNSYQGSLKTYALTFDSPALDAGYCEQNSDQRGLPRPFNFESIDNSGNGCDIGAYERQNSPPNQIFLSATVIKENSLPNTPFAILTAQDPDPSSSFQFALVDRENFPDNANFEIRDNQLIVINSPDYETQSQFVIQVEVTDNNRSPFRKVFPIQVLNLNDPAEIIVSANPVFFEGREPVRLFENVTLVDQDKQAEIEACIISFSNTYHSDQDHLFIHDTDDGHGSINGIKWNYDSSSGILHLSGVAGIDIYQAVLHQILYRNTSSNPQLQPREIAITITPPGQSEAIVQIFELEIIGFNDPPTGVPDQFQVIEGHQSSSGINLLANDHDPENGKVILNPEPAEQTKNGTLTLFADGNLNYIHDGSETLNDHFMYEICDDHDPPACNIIPVSITIVPENDVPFPQADQITLHEGTTTSELTTGNRSLLDNDLDTEGNTLQVSTTLIRQPEYGQAILQADGTFTYEHHGSEHFSDQFEYQVCDDGEPQACQTATVIVDILPVNDPPLPTVDKTFIQPGEITSILEDGTSNLLENDLDPEGDPLTLGVNPVEPPQFGELTLRTDGHFEYIHDGTDVDRDRFIYQVCDTASPPACATSEVIIEISPPLGVDDYLEVVEGQSTSQLVNGEVSLLANDTAKTDDPLIIKTAPDIPPAFGNLQLASNGSFEYQHDGSETSEDRFTYFVCKENIPDQCQTGQVWIRVIPENDPPSAQDDRMILEEGSTSSRLESGSSNLLRNDFDLENDVFEISTTLIEPPQYGSIVLFDNGQFQYRHDGTENYQDEFTYQVCEIRAPEQCGSARVEIEVIPVNDPPAASPQRLTIGEGHKTQEYGNGQTNLLEGFTDPENMPLVLIETPVFEPQHGKIELHADGSFIYQHDGSESHIDQVTYQVCDTGTPINCVDNTLTVDIVPVNDPPIPGADHINITEGSIANILNDGSDNLILNDYDPEGDIFTISTSPVQEPEHGSLIIKPTGKFIYSHDDSETTEDLFIYQICSADSPEICGQAEVNITIQPSNDPPLVSGVELEVIEGADQISAGPVNLLENMRDPEGGSLRLSTTPGDPPIHGVLELSVDGSFRYAHNGTETRSDSFTFSVCDDGEPVLCSKALASITILPDNDRPQAAPDIIRVEEGKQSDRLESNTTSLLANDTDIEDDTLTVSAEPIQQPLFGQIQLFDDGTFLYIHDGSETTEDQFTYEVCDNGTPTKCSSADVRIEIQPVNSAPVAGEDKILVTEGQSNSFLSTGDDSLLDNDTDPDSRNLFVNTNATDLPVHGQLSLGKNGGFSYLHDGSETKTDSFTYTVCDQDEPQQCAQAQVLVEIIPADDAPIGIADTLIVPEGGSISVTENGLTSLLDNDTDAENDQLQAHSLSYALPEHGNLTLNADGTFIYVHDGSETRTDQFAYQVSEIQNPEKQFIAEVFIQITPTNDAPVSEDDIISVYEGGSVQATADGRQSLSENDYDIDNMNLSVDPEPVVEPSSGQIELHTDGTFRYTHNGQETTADEFVYRVCDSGEPQQCNQSRVQVQIFRVNDPPIAEDDQVAISEGDVISGINVLSNDQDAENDQLSIGVEPILPPVHGVLILDSSGIFTYQHDGSEANQDSFSYRVCDGGNPVGCDEAQVRIAIENINDAPLLNTDFIQVEQGQIAQVLVTGERFLTANDFDAEGQKIIVATEPASPPLFGRIILAENGQFTYIHQNGQNTEDSFAYWACDQGLPPACGAARVNIKIIPFNHPPIPNLDVINFRPNRSIDLLANGEISLLANDFDLDGDRLRIDPEPVSGPYHGTVELNANGSFIYRHDGGTIINDSFEYRVCDNGTPQKCAVGVANLSAVSQLSQTTLPTILNNQAAEVFAGQSVMLSQENLSAQDSQSSNHQLVYILAEPPQQGVIYNLTYGYIPLGKNAAFTQEDIDNGKIIYQNLNGYSPTDQFEFKVRNKNLQQTARQTFRINIIFP